MNIGAGIGIGFAEPRGVLAFEYEQSSGCQNGSDITPIINTPGGTFSSSPSGLSIDSSTGVIDVSASDAGTYTVTYSIGPTEDTITIEAVDDASFAYSQSSYSQADADPTPTPVLAGGTFSAGSGLVFVDSGSNTGSSTGEIDLSASTIATYTITYTTAGTCPNTSTQSVGITSALAQVNNVHSMAFDGINDFISGGNSLTNGFSQLTISIWANFASVPTSRVMGLVAKDNTNQRSVDFRYIQNTGVNFLVSTDGVNSTGTTYYPKASISTGQWYHFVGVYDGSNVLLYVNGVAYGTPAALTGSLQNTTSEFFIGKRGFGLTNTSFDGKIDEVGIFNVALTAQEVSSIYNATETGKTADLDDLTTPPVKWYRMGD
jgi:hypothetical protein